MDDDCSNVVRMSLKGGDFLGSIIVIDSNLKVIRPTDNPVFAGDEPASSHGYIGKLKGLDDCLASDEHRYIPMRRNRHT